jgi:hypothetical protein
MIMNYYLFEPIFNSVAIATGYGMDGRGNEVQFLAGGRHYSLLHSI